MIYNQVTLDSHMFSIGAILGTSSQDIVRNINAQFQQNSGNFYYGSDTDIFRDRYLAFMNQVVKPLQSDMQRLTQMKLTVSRPNEYRAITSVEELKQGIPPIMWDGIVSFGPIRQLAEENKIEAFGLDVRSLPSEDAYGRLIDNGTVRLWEKGAVAEDGTVVFQYEWKSTDPEITEDQLEMLDETRQFLIRFLNDPETKHLDPTALMYGELRGM